MEISPDDLIDIYRSARLAQFQYNLELYEHSVLQSIRVIVDRAKDEAESQVGAAISAGRTQRLVEELEELSAGIVAQTSNKLLDHSAVVGSRTLAEAYNVMSVGGLSPVVNDVALSPAQFRSFLATSPVNGLLIPQWVSTAYRASVMAPMLDVLREGALTGGSYGRIVNTLEQGFSDFTRRDLTTLTRTFFQDANVRAHREVMEANRDIVEGWIWTVVDDDSVCILCLPLSENFYRMDEESPPMPRHPNCRCMPRTKTVSYRSLGIDIDELEPINRAVVQRGYKHPVTGKWVVSPIGTGGRRIRGVSFQVGGIKGNFDSLPEGMQRRLLGPKRLELYREGLLPLHRMVDPKTGQLVLLRDLRFMRETPAERIARFNKLQAERLAKGISVAAAKPKAKPKPKPKPKPTAKTTAVPAATVTPEVEAQPRGVVVPKYLNTEQSLRNLPIENGYGFDSAGNVIWHNPKGTKTSVNVPKKDWKLLTGQTLTHNHPSGSSFSIGDIDLAHDLRLREMRAVTNSHTYSMRPPPGGWQKSYLNPDTGKNQKLGTIVNSRIKQVQQDLMSEFKVDTLTTEQFNNLVPTLQLEHMHRVWTSISKDLGFIYERVPYVSN